MENKQSELVFENQRLEETISLAKKQLDEAKEFNEENRKTIISEKKDLRENTSHSISNLWNSESFEALVELSQYENIVTDKIAVYEATENKIAKLEQLIKSPYFARIDFKFDDDDEDEFEKVYIGRSSLIDKDSYDMFVYDWRSPIASVFYRFMLGKALYEAPNGTVTGKVNLKRQYEINEGVLEYFFDADIHIIDEVLRKLLSQNTSPKMKTIVESIQRDQDIVIRDMDNDLMMVQGVAGSGKTSIALHRAAYLMYQGLSSRLCADNIIIISPNTLFEKYISSVLPELGEDNVVSVVFEGLLSKILQNKHIQTKNQLLEQIINNSKYSEITKSSLEFKTSDTFIEILNRFIDDLPKRWIDFEDVYYNGKLIINKEALREKIISGRKITPIGVRLKQLEDYVIDLIVESQKNRISKAEKAQIKNEMQGFIRLNPKSLYKNLLSDSDYFLSLTKDLDIPDNINFILKFTNENLNGNYLYYDDASVIAFLSLKLNGANEYKNIKQVVIDEAQDYYPIHFEIFNILFSNSKYTVLGDINQTLEKQEDLTFYEHVGKILNKKRSSLATMNKSFRCTKEILNFSSNFLEKSFEIESFNRGGDKPEVYRADDQESLNDMIISEVKLCLERGFKSIGLICKTEKSSMYLYDNIKDDIDVKLIESDTSVDLNGVSIIPVYMSKGIEFDAVLVCDADTDNYNSEDDKKLLYIACTRALHRLNLFYKGELNTLL